MVFVTLQALLLGNNVFSFYRYYGISSSIYAQLGAVALTRIVLEATNQRIFRKSAGWSTAPSISWLAGALLLALTTFSHKQGLGIAVLGVGAVAIWRLIVWKHSVLWWLLSGTLAANALFLWLYPQPALAETFRAAGYFNIWHGFNILDLDSPAGDRMLQIVSAFGLVNLVAALVLLRRNHVIGWLTVLPLGVMLLPIVAVPLTQVLTDQGDKINYIITFQRMLFSIPPCLGLVGLGAQLVWEKEGLESRRPNSWNGFPAFAFVCGGLLALIVVSSSAPAYNRTWHSGASLPRDLGLRDVFAEYESIRPQLLQRPEAKSIATQLGTALLYSYPDQVVGPSPLRLIATPATDSAMRAVDFLSLGVKITASAGAPQSGLPVGPAPANLLEDPNAGNPAAWTVLGGHAPEFISGLATSPRSSSTALQNPVGETSNVFTTRMVPINPLSSYHVEMTVRQTAQTAGILYLAVAWYDAGGNSLYSNIALPQGAGYPRGWQNGAYSYFGLVAQAAPTAWATHGISFGLNEIAAIPSQARFMRVGALLNSNATPAAKIQLTGVRLFEKLAPAIGLSVPQATSPYSVASQAAQLSRHWPAQQVMTDRVGTREIEAASRSALDQAPVPLPPAH